MRIGRWKRAVTSGLLAAVLPCLAQAELLFAVSEGTSGGGASITDAQMATKYKALVDVMEKALGDKVSVRYVRDFKALEAGMREGRFDLVMARPSDYPARGIRDYGYQAVSATRPDGHCLIVVRKDAPYRSLAELNGKTFILPEESAYMTKFCLAELRDQGIRPERVHYVREQAVIPFSLTNHLAVAGGVASYSGVARRLDAEGLKVLLESRPQPYLPLIAGKRISAAKVEALRAGLKELSATEPGAQSLAALGLKDFDMNPQQRLLALLSWLEKK